MKDAEWCERENVHPAVLEIARVWERSYFYRTGTEHDVRALAERIAGLDSFDYVFLVAANS